MSRGFFSVNKTRPSDQQHKRKKIQIIHFNNENLRKGKHRWFLCETRSLFWLSVFIFIHLSTCFSVCCQSFPLPYLFHSLRRDEHAGTADISVFPPITLIEALSPELILDPALIEPQPHRWIVQGHSDLTSNRKILTWLVAVISFRLDDGKNNCCLSWKNGCDYIWRIYLAGCDIELSSFTWKKSKRNLLYDWETFLTLPCEIFETWKALMTGTWQDVVKCRVLLSRVI